jgi:hypothetical protein
MPPVREIIDCLVCLQPIKRLWTPPTTCPCKPFIHERCWNIWVKHMGTPICVICRGLPEHRPVAAIIVAHHVPHHDGDNEPRRLPFYHRVLIVYTPWITMTFIILTLVWFQFQTRRMQFHPLTAGRPPLMPIPLPSLPPYPFNNRDEL